LSSTRTCSPRITESASSPPSGAFTST
jgi:hypothetical protein